VTVAWRGLPCNCQSWLKIPHFAGHVGNSSETNMHLIVALDSTGNWHSSPLFEFNLNPMSFSKSMVSKSEVLFLRPPPGLYTSPALGLLCY
jgi:hypothetical protein